MKRIPYIIVLGFLFACSNNNKSEKKAELKKEVNQVVHANAQLDLEVEGMVCQMGCGGSMRKELKKTGAVERVEVNFIEGKDIQLVQVSYDSMLISPSKITTILNTINDQQFSAKLIAKRAI